MIYSANPRGTPHTAEFKERVKALYLQTNPQLSMRQIGAEVGLTKNSVIGILNRMPDVPRRPSPVCFSGKPRAPRAPRVGSRPTLAALPSVAVVRAPVRVSQPVAAPERSPEPIDAPLSPTMTCQFITNDRKPYVFCGAPAIVGKAWCPCHYRRVYHKSARQEAA